MCSEGKKVPIITVEGALRMLSILKSDLQDCTMDAVIDVALAVEGGDPETIQKAQENGKNPGLEPLRESIKNKNASRNMGGGANMVGGGDVAMGGYGVGAVGLFQDPLLVHMQEIWKSQGPDVYNKEMRDQWNLQLVMGTRIAWETETDPTVKGMIAEKRRMAGKLLAYPDIVLPDRPASDYKTVDDILREMGCTSYTNAVASVIGKAMAKRFRETHNGQNPKVNTSSGEAEYLEEDRKSMPHFLEQAQKNAAKPAYVDPGQTLMGSHFPPST